MIHTHVRPTGLVDGGCPVIIDGSQPFMSAFAEGKRGNIRQENADTTFITGLQKRLIAKGYSHIQPADIINLKATSGSGSKRGREDDNTDEEDESNSNNEAKVGADKTDKQSKHRNKKRREDVAAEEDAEVSANATKDHRKKKNKAAEVDADENSEQVTPGGGRRNRRILHRTESTGDADESRGIGGRQLWRIVSR